MSPFRLAIVLPLCVSLSLHAAMGWSISRYGFASFSPGPEPIQISYAEPRKPSKPLMSQAAVKNAPSVPKKKLRGIPVPRLPAQEEPPAQVFEPPAPRIEAPAVKESPRNSAEILADPRKGKIFVEYFTEVRRKIQETLSERYGRRYSVRGSVAIGFVLNSRGFLEKVAVLTKGTDGDEYLQGLAVQCLRESAPFGAFPPDLGSDRIAFNVTLFFVDR